MVSAPDWYADALVVDALQLSRWDRELFEELRAGGLSCVHVTCAFWEDARATLSTLGAWERRFREHADIVVPVRCAADVEAARSSGRTGILLGFQNASPIENDLDLVGAFRALGVRIVQLTYNNQSLLGSSCYEREDAGLTRFGRLVVREMNDLGLLVDLSHVGARTSLDAIEHSAAPVAITHANPAFALDVPRNKPLEVLRACAQRGGVVGLCVYPLVLPGGADCSWESFLDMLLRTVHAVGIEHVGIGTDFTRKQPVDFIRWLRAGRWTREPDQTVQLPRWPTWLPSPADFPRFAGRLADAGLTEHEARLLLGENWMRLFAETLGER
jgi:microsomal dipeptidase-like Zn-dependent dipeptidase